MNKLTAAIIITASILGTVTADTNDVAQAKAKLDAARAEYTAACKAAGINPVTRRANRKAATSTAIGKVIDKRATSFFNNRRICVQRDTTTIPGYVIEHWQRNGRPDTKGPAVVTNKLHAVLGKEQSNPLENEVKPLRQMVNAARKSKKKDQKTWDNMIKDIEKARNKFIEQEFIDLANQLLTILDQSTSPEGN